MHKLRDGRYYSPDIGRFIAKGDFLYTEYGYVRDNDTMYIRLIESDFVGEDFTEWNEQQRLEIRTKWESIWAQNEREDEEYRSAEVELVKVARAKLTEEEFNAVANFYKH